MTDFDIFKVLDLGFLGSEWEGCFLKFHYLSASEARDFSELNIDTSNKEGVKKIYEQVVKVLEKKFVEGKAVLNGEKVSVKKEEIRDFPTEVLNKCLEIMVGLNAEKKSL